MQMCDGTGGTDGHHDEIVHDERECPMCAAKEKLDGAGTEVKKVQLILQKLTDEIDNHLTVKLGDMGVLGPDTKSEVRELSTYTPLVSENMVRSWLRVLNDLDNRLDIDTELD